MNKYLLLFITILFIDLPCFCQVSSNDKTEFVEKDPNSLIVENQSQPKIWKDEYSLGNNRIVKYAMPKPFDFITKVPGDLLGFTKYSFTKESIPWLSVIAFTSAVLIANDQIIINEVQGLSDRNNIERVSSYNNVFAPKLDGKNVNIISIPKNLNTVFYTLGQGYPALLLGGGIFIYGLSHHDVRAVSTASQLAEAFIAMGITTQVVKRITGRETPLEASRPGGNWKPFPPFADYQKHTTTYDAFPSGHLATIMCAVTILTENYPEKKWIKPVGYSLAGLVSYAMINNGVHWAGDYPMAIGIGYAFGKVVAGRSRTFIVKP